MLKSLAVLVLAGIPTVLVGQGVRVPLDAAEWRVEPKGAGRVTLFHGRTALVMGSGEAFRRDLHLEDGTIEFDFFATGSRAFVYLQFRMVTDRDHEEIYFRPHKSGLPDAIQYAPVDQGISAWQLFHGLTGTAAAEINRGGWTHVRIVVAGRQAAVFVGDVREPQLVVPRLAREPAEGYFALRSLLPVGVDPAANAVGFADLVVRPGVIPYEFSRAAGVEEVGPDVIRRWEVSRAFVPASGPIRSLPDSVVRTAEWRTLQTDPTGLLVLNAQVPLPPGVRRWAALLRLTLTSAEPRTVVLELGFSDDVTVFLNGRAIMSGDQHYSFDSPRQEGVIGFHQGTAYLPLGRGPNEVVLAIADSFGGWGVMARLSQREGVGITP